MIGFLCYLLQSEEVPKATVALLDKLHANGVEITDIVSSQTTILSFEIRIHMLQGLLILISFDFGSY